MTDNGIPLEDLAGAGCDYKHVSVKLIGFSGNIFFIIGAVSKALRRAGAPQKEVAAFQRQAMASESYHQALAVVQDWVTVE